MKSHIDKLLNSKKLVFFIISIIIIITFLIIKYMTTYTFILGEDTSAIMVPFNYWIKHPNNCNYISSSIDIILGAILPSLLDIHSSDFISMYFSYIQIPLIVSLAFILNSFLFQDIKKNYFYAVSFLLVITIIFEFIQFNPFILFQYECFHRVFLQITLWLFLLLILIKNIKNKSTIYYFLIPFTTFIVCLSKEPMCVSTLVTLLVYSIVLFFDKEEKKTFKIILFSLFFAVLDFIILLKLGAFLRKIPLPAEEILNVQYFSNMIKTIPVFSIQYIRDLFVSHLFQYAIFIIQLSFLLSKLKEDKNLKHTLKILCCFLFGTLVFFYSLIFMGIYKYTGEYCTSHQDLQFFYSLLLFSFNLILLNYLIKYNLCKKYIISIIFFILSFILIYQNYYFYKNVLKYLRTLRYTTYKAEKILRLASIKNKTAYLDKEILNSSYLYALFLEENYYINFLNQFENEENKIKCKFIFANKFLVEQEFKNNGGNFTKEELRNIKFGNLLHNKFFYEKQ